MGLMCKPMLVTLPFVLLLLDYWPLQRVEPRKLSRLVLEKLPLLALSAASCMVTLVAQIKVIHSAGSFSLPLRFANALVACKVYLVQMFYPAGLAAFYPFPRNGLSAWETALDGTLLAVLSAVAWGERQTRPWLLMGWVWYLVMLLPVVGFIQAGEQAHADRYTYLPQIGIYVAVTWLVSEWRVGRAALGGMMAGVLAVLMVCAWIQTGYWKSSEILWTETLACTTGNHMAHFNLGNALVQKGRVDEGITHFREALTIKPGFVEAHNNFGTALFQKGSVDEAITHYREALEIRPGFAEAHYNLGNALVQKGRVDEAIAEYQQVVEIRPDYAEAQNNLGYTLLQKGRVDEAITHCQQAVQIKPDFADAHNNLGNALGQKGRVEEAITQFHQALQINPALAEARNNLGNALLQRGRVEEAITQFHQALKIRPDLAEAHNSLGAALSQEGKVDEAIACFQKALAINPGYAAARRNLEKAILKTSKN
jgi:tetratricopeptide (TPR) repeat protein